MTICDYIAKDYLAKLKEMLLYPAIEHGFSICENKETTPIEAGSDEQLSREEKCEVTLGVVHSHPASTTTNTEDFNNEEYFQWLNNHLSNDDILTAAQHGNEKFKCVLYPVNRTLNCYSLIALKDDAKRALRNKEKLDAIKDQLKLFGELGESIGEVDEGIVTYASDKLNEQKYRAYLNEYNESIMNLKSTAIKNKCSITIPG
jgi:hypothetical protein